MSSEQQSCLRFSVEESVWFQKGQEVSELISIALDPDIQIYDQDQYVSIRGALLLTGEYLPNKEVEEEDEEYRPFTQARVVQEVEEREDGVCSLKHRFPVDVTIPKNRIQSLDDIYVSIESFDYSVPARGCLQLDAELSISGIYGHQQSTPVVEEQEEPELEPLYRNPQDDNENEGNDYQYYTNSENEEEEEEEILNQDEIDSNVQYDYNHDGEYEPFDVEARKSAVVDEVTHVVETHAEEPSEEVNHATDTYQIDNAVTDTTQEVNHAADTYQIDNVVTDTYQEVNHAADTHQIDNAVTDTYQEVDRAKDTFSFEDDKVYTEDPFTPLYAFQPNKKTESKEEENPQNIASFFEKRKTKQKEAEVEQVVEIEAPDENSLSLTKIFAEEEGEELTRIKICIVQQGESIDHIAERYDVTIQQLIRINRLSTEDNVHDGQLLYIPVKAVSKT